MSSSQFSRKQRETILVGLAALIAAERLRFPRQVVTELQRYLGTDQPALQWALTNNAAIYSVDLQDVKDVLAEVPEVLDPDKEGVEEADPYVLASALSLQRDDKDARVVTEEFKTTGQKMALGSAAGYLGIPSLSLRAVLKFEGILDF